MTPPKRLRRLPPRGGASGRAKPDPQRPLGVERLLDAAPPGGLPSAASRESAEADPRRLLSARQPVAQYKRILRAVLDNRPSGTRQRLADALGKNRSFISQIASPAYAVPIPAQHVDTILEVCHFAPSQRKAFLAAYAIAHCGKPAAARPAAALRTLTLTVPDLGSAGRNQLVDRMIDEVAVRMVRFARDMRLTNHEDES